MSAEVQRVLVTGASGFVGSVVARQLLDSGRKVAVLLRAGSPARRLQPLLPRLQVVVGDLQGAAATETALQGFAPQAVLHLAWDGVKGGDRNSPMQADNVAGSLALYQLAERLGAELFVGLGSQAEYGPAPGMLDESAPTRPTTVYGAAKLATGVLLERLAAASGRHFAWLRLFSSYGNDDDPSWLLPYLTRTLLAGGRPVVTAAEQRWDYIHVEDVARAVVAAMDWRARGVFNLGSGTASSLKQTITMLRDFVNPRLPIGFGELPYRPDQVMHLQADIAALSAATGWAPQVQLEQGLRDLVAWYRAQPEPPN